MSLSCIITVPGDGVGRYGNSKDDRVGPVESFLVDNQVLYREVIKHLRKCKVCDPKEALQIYLKRRLENPKFEGQISMSLISHAMKFKNVFKERGLPVPTDLIEEFMWRVGTPSGLINFAHQLSTKQLIQGMIHIKEQDRKTRGLTHNSVAEIFKAYKYKYSDLIEPLAVIVDNMFTTDCPYPSDEELQYLISVATVMLS